MVSGREKEMIYSIKIKILWFPFIHFFKINIKRVMGWFKQKQQITNFSVGYSPFFLGTNHFQTEDRILGMLEPLITYQDSATVISLKVTIYFSCKSIKAMNKATLK